MSRSRQKTRKEPRHLAPAKAGPSRQPSAPEQPAHDLWIYLGLVLATILVYSQVRHYGFISYDDPDYVTANAHVQSGLTVAGVVWAFTSGHATNWHPLTWISHMLDFELFGLGAGWHHLVNVLLHLLSTLLLFAFLKQTTGARWRSAFVAFVFALHPLHVESVAWIAERKDVLSGFFWFLTLWAYAGYVERPDPRRYALTLVPSRCWWLCR
jgi:hypothetical protein